METFTRKHSLNSISSKIPLIQILIVWIPLIWIFTHPRPCRISLCWPTHATSYYGKMRLNSSEVFSREIVSPQFMQIHLMRNRLISCEIISSQLIFTSAAVSTQRIRIIFMCNHPYPTREIFWCEVFSCAIFSRESASFTHVKSSHAKLPHLNSWEIFSCEIASSTLVKSHAKFPHLKLREIFSCEIASSTHVKSSHVILSHSNSRMKLTHPNSCELFLCQADWS